MATPGTDRKAEYSIGIGLTLGALSGYFLGNSIFGEAVAGLIIGGGIGLVFGAAFCGLSSKLGQE